MNTKSPECWASDPQAKGLRVEASGEISLLLPFDQFVYAELTGNREHRLRMVFATHEVLVNGYNLRRVQGAIQRMELAFVTVVSASFQPAAGDNQALIREIVVTKVDPTAKSAPETVK